MPLGVGFRAKEGVRFSQCVRSLVYFAARVPFVQTASSLLLSSEGGWDT